MKSSASRTLVFLALIITAAIIIVSAVSNEYTTVLPQPKEPVSIISEEGLININTADAETLTLLDGIGEARAQMIIDFRNENGYFVTKEDILRIDGIGKTLFEKFKNDITV
ncbi:MAG: ComEA family DNA-binding protein [Clostridia bacterium]|nr:ComEA family DNA-binding protein [Clostridia bacterium]